MRKILGLFVLFSALPIFGQTDNDQPTQDERNRSVLGVQHGSEAIKNKDLYDNSGTLHPFRRMPKFVLYDQKMIWTSPFHSSKKDVKWWAIFGGATAGLIAADKHIARNAPNPPGLITLGKDVSYLGDPYTLIPIAAGFYFIGTAKGSDHFRETGLLSFETLIDVTAVELVLKSVFDRQRPLEGHGNGEFEASTSPRWNSSFPSGHAIETFALASIIAHEYRHTRWVQVLAYAYAGGVVGARLAANRHFPGDVMFGGSIGWFIGDYVYGRRHNTELDGNGKRSVSQRVLDHVHLGGPPETPQLDDADLVRSTELAHQIVSSR